MRLSPPPSGQCAPAHPSRPRRKRRSTANGPGGLGAGSVGKQGPATPCPSGPGIPGPGAPAWPGFLGTACPPQAAAIGIGGEMAMAQASVNRADQPFPLGKKIIPARGVLASTDPFALHQLPIPQVDRAVNALALKAPEHNVWFSHCFLPPIQTRRAPTHYFPPQTSNVLPCDGPAPPRDRRPWLQWAGPRGAIPRWG